jgi:uncharacterized membrane protein YfcA
MGESPTVNFQGPLRGRTDWPSVMCSVGGGAVGVWAGAAVVRRRRVAAARRECKGSAPGAGS